jgi:hypothetical protein
MRIVTGILFSLFSGSLEADGTNQLESAQLSLRVLIRNRSCLEKVGLH